MFCPQCGQQQVSGDVRFCSRCGFQLGVVTGLLASGGVLPAGLVQGAMPSQSHVTPRRKGVRQGGQLLLFGIFLIPVMAIMHEIIGTPDELPLIGLLVFFAGLLRTVYALIFEEGPLRQPKLPLQFHYSPPMVANQFPHRDTASELPPGQGAPARSYAPPRANTAEFTYRPSVTENPTRLLDEHDDTPGR